MESGRNAGAAVHDARRAWRLLRSNPDYVADWRANGGPVAREPPPFPLRRQTVAYLNAARWNLLAWEAPSLAGRAAPFWADVPMLEGRALDVGKSTGQALCRVVVRSGATFWGLRLRDGGLVIRVARGRKAEQIRVRDGKSFDPARSGLEFAVPADTFPCGEWVRVETVDAVVFGEEYTAEGIWNGFGADIARRKCPYRPRGCLKSGWRQP